MRLSEVIFSVMSMLQNDKCEDRTTCYMPMETDATLLQSDINVVPAAEVRGVEFAYILDN